MSQRALLKNLIRREVNFRKDFIIGTVLTDKRMFQFDQSVGGAPVFVTSVEIGSSRPLIDVIILAAADGSRRYADAGKTVMLSKNTMGRYDIIGPADRVAGEAVVKTYNMGSAAEVTSEGFGYSAFRVPFEWYGYGWATNDAKWADGDHPFRHVEIQDADGNPI